MRSTASANVLPLTSSAPISAELPYNSGAMDASGTGLSLVAAKSRRMLRTTGASMVLIADFTYSPKGV